jgi:hypothetical protein
MRWEQGQWSEDRILESINATEAYRAIPYGRSAIGPSERERLNEYWEEYSALEGVGKRPDILVLRRDDHDELAGKLAGLGDTTLAGDEALSGVIAKAVCGIEAENSLWIAERMPDYGKETITRLNFVAPTVIVKEEDAPRLHAWEEHFRVPICIVHLFFDRGFVVRLSDVLLTVRRIEGVMSRDVNAGRALQKELGLNIKAQSYTDSRTGAASTKLIYRLHHTRATEFGVVNPADPPEPVANFIAEDNGRIMAYVRFQGGKLDVAADALELFDELARERSLDR